MISYGPIGRENQFKQTKISSEEKVKVHQSYSRENDKRKKFMRDNFSKDEKEQLKKDDKKEREKCVITSRKKKKKDNKRKTPKRDNLDDSEKEQLRKYKKEGKKVMRHDLDDEKRSI